MPSTIITDDSVTLIDTIKEFIRDNNIQDVVCLTSLVEAFKIVNQEEPKRVIADLVFEGESEDGITLLEIARNQYPEAECILLTGYLLNDSQLRRCRKINAKVVNKANLTDDLLRNLLIGEIKAEGGEGDLKVQEDIGEIRLKYEKIDKLLNELIQDIYEELSRIPNQDEKALMVGDKMLSIADLRKHIEQKTDIGTRAIEMYRALNKKIRELL